MNENIASQVINHISKGEPLFEMVTPEFNMKVMAAFDAGRRSCETGIAEYAEEPFQL